jgi:hypothetical protein
MEPDDHDWYVAACADATVENLPLAALQAAYEVSTSPQEFFWAIWASIKLKDLMNG